MLLRFSAFLVSHTKNTYLLSNFYKQWTLIIALYIMIFRVWNLQYTIFEGFALFFLWLYCKRLNIWWEYVLRIHIILQGKYLCSVARLNFSHMILEVLIFKLFSFYCVYRIKLQKQTYENYKITVTVRNFSEYHSNLNCVWKYKKMREVASNAGIGAFNRNRPVRWLSANELQAIPVY